MPRHLGHKARRKPQNTNTDARAVQARALTPQNQPHWDEILTGRARYDARESDRYHYIDMAYSLGFSGKRMMELKLLDIHKDEGLAGPHERVTLNRLLLSPKFDKR